VESTFRGRAVAHAILPTPNRTARLCPRLGRYTPVMTIELTLLAATVFVGILHIVVISQLQSWQRGYRWTASSRAEPVPPLTGVAGRVERALRNYLETYPFFVAAIVMITVTGTHTWLTAWGAQLYFWGRLVYALLYAANFSLARSLVWNIPTLGIVMIVVAPWVR
jgi:uncharacterized MAPEG superfamily protein